jgi:hypothetical protein
MIHFINTFLFFVFFSFNLNSQEQDFFNPYNNNPFVYADPTTSKKDYSIKQDLEIIIKQQIAKNNNRITIKVDETIPIDTKNKFIKIVGELNASYKNFNIDLVFFSKGTEITEFEIIIDKTVNNIFKIKQELRAQKNTSEINTIINKLDLLSAKLNGLKNLIDSNFSRIEEYYNNIRAIELTLKELDESKSKTNNKNLHHILDKHFSNSNFINKISTINLFARAYINFIRIYAYSWVPSSATGLYTGWGKTLFSLAYISTVYANDFFSSSYTISTNQELKYFLVLGAFTAVQEWFFGPRIGVFLNILNNVKNNFNNSKGQALHLNIKNIKIEYAPIIYNFFQGTALAGIPKELIHRINPSKDGFISSDFLLGLIGPNLFNTALSALVGVELKNGLVEKGWIRKKHSDVSMNVLDLISNLKLPLLLLDHHTVYWVLFAIFDVALKGGVYGLSKAPHKEEIILLFLKRFNIYNEAFLTKILHIKLNITLEAYRVYNEYVISILNENNKDNKLTISKLRNNPIYKTHLENLNRTFIKFYYNLKIIDFNKLDSYTKNSVIDIFLKMDALHQKSPSIFPWYKNFKDEITGKNKSFNNALKSAKSTNNKSTNNKPRAKGR